MVKRIYKVIKNIDIKTPFPRLPYKDAMLRYGSDKPDLRFGMEIVELTDVLKDSEFKIFKDTVEKGGVIRGITVKGGAKFSRKEIDDYTKYVYIFKAKGLVSFKITEEGIQSPAVKFLPDEMKNKLIKKANAEIGDIIFVIADQEKIASVSLGALRLKLGKDLKLIDENRIELMWIVDFPMFERNEEEKRWEAMHHPFTSPNTEDLEFLEKDPGKVRAYAYDLVLNGVEIAGGSIRNHRSDNQKRVFNIIGLTEEEAKYKFGFLIEALSYGAPPHGGIAFGLDRLVMELLGIDSIREVVPFPKTQTASDIMCDAPSIVDEKQLKELHIKIIEEEH
jgi:aspartyl-tRNA synthetase